MATGGSSGPIILLLGQTVQALPWEATPTLAKSSVGRMPSLMFTVAHRHLVSHTCTCTCGLVPRLRSQRTVQLENEARCVSTPCGCGQSVM